jgi:hypothetical protein
VYWASCPRWGMRTGGESNGACSHRLP